MRVGIIALLHESNTFISSPTTRRHFEEDTWLVGEAVRELSETPHEIGGFFEGLASEEITPVPILAARAVPHGAITADALDALVAGFAAGMKQAGRLDGLLVAPHGAAVSEQHGDADGYWLGEARRHLGAAPIVGTLDAHANLTRRMVETTDALIAYRTNPHLDQRDRGIEAARLMARALRGEVKPVQAACFPPLAISIERQCTEEPQLRPLLQSADSLRERPGILSASVLLGFPYADVPEMGSSTLAVADGQPGLAAEAARNLADVMWRSRANYVGQLLDIDAALTRIADLPGTICLLDMGDNVGGGSPADGTYLLHAIRRREIGPALVCINDPEAVEQASQAGPGRSRRMRVGGKTDDRHGAPLEAVFLVRGLYDGHFEEPLPRHGGYTVRDQGPTAVIETEKQLTIMLTSRRMPPFSLRQLTTFGIDPPKYRVLVAKGVNAPLAAYREVCREFLRVNTPGCTTADMRQLPFARRRRPLFPFESGAEWRPTRA